LAPGSGLLSRGARRNGGLRQCVVWCVVAAPGQPVWSARSLWIRWWTS